MFKRTKRYRPELHFMRGPGPKWFQKHGGKIDLANAGIQVDTGKPLLSFFFQLVRTWCRH